MGTDVPDPARSISAVTTPYLTTPLFILLAGLYFVTEPRDVLVFGAIVIGSAIVVPLTYAEHLRRAGRVDSIHIFDQQARLGPLALTGFCSLVAMGLLMVAGAPEGIVRLGALLFLLAGTVLVATYFYKVSGHVSAWTSGTTVLVLLYGPLASSLFLVAGPIAWSRTRLGRHTSSEVVVGFVYGIVTATVLSYLVGLW